MFQNWETPITQWKARKSSSMVWRIICHDSEVEPAYYYRYAQSLRSISENDKANQIMEKFDQISETIIEGNFCQNEYMDAIKANSGR
jgi:hypothetical protein